MEPLVEPQWLASRLQDPNVKVLDTAWYLPIQNRDAIVDFTAERIPGCQLFDLDGIAATDTTLLHMLPNEQQFAAAMDALGITNDTTVVLFDHLGIFSAPRVWWTFKVFGHDKVAILSGGLPAWKAAGLPTEHGRVAEDVLKAATRAARNPPATTHYRAKMDKSKVRNLDDMLANITSKKEQVMDARSAGRFVGTEPEPRPGLRGGHIPGARSLPFPTLLQEGRFKPKDQLQAAFDAAGIDLGKPLVGSCGTGLTACVLAHAVYQLTGQIVPVYDGSWSEWGARSDLPISTTPEH